MPVCPMRVGSTHKTLCLSVEATFSNSTNILLVTLLTKKFNDIIFKKRLNQASTKISGIVNSAQIASLSLTTHRKLFS